MIAIILSAFAAEPLPSDCIQIELVRDGSDRDRPVATTTGRIPPLDMPDEVFTRSRAAYERVAIRATATKSDTCFAGKDPKVHVEITRAGDASVSVLTTDPTPLISGSELELVRVPFSALYAKATSTTSDEPQPMRRALDVTVVVEEDGKSAKRTRTLTTNYNPRLVPSIVSHASLVAGYATDDGSWDAEVLSIAPAGFHLRWAPAKRTGNVGASVDVTVLDTSLLKVSSSNAAASVQASVMPVRLTGGLDLTYDAGFLAGKHIYAYGGMGVRVDGDNGVGVTPVVGLSLLTPFDFGTSAEK
jgi:hypothetical protein